MRKSIILLSAASLAIVVQGFALNAYGEKEPVSDYPGTNDEASPYVYVVEHPSEAMRAREVETVALGKESAPKETVLTAESVETAAEATDSDPDHTEAIVEEVTEEPFELTDELVAEKIYAYFSAKGYTTAQIAGIIGNAEAESGLEPSRGVEGGGFGLFQLMDYPQRDEMFAAFDAAGVGKYAAPEYWGFGESAFDNKEDFEAYMDILLEYTMDEEDPTWMSELREADSPELAAEIFLVHYERAVDGWSPVEYYSPYCGELYQATDSRREYARKWYEYFAG